MTKKTNPGVETHEPAPSSAEAPATGAGATAPDRSGETEAGQAATNDGNPEALAKLAADNAELRDQLLRALAEVENVRRRAERDLNDMRQYAVARFAGDMLNVADNLERAISSVPAETPERDAAVKTLIEGVQLTEKELQRALEKHGVKRFDPVGERFDPNFHQALFAVPDSSVPSGTVSKVVEPGYSIGSRVLRPAKVGVTSGVAQA